MPAPGWPGALRPLRDSYSAVRKHHLRYIKHPELLNELPLDPLADDPVSPWAALREDELVRAEILQDVQRLPDEPLYREESIRAIILDILFLYCKLHPRVGGYRQGMHELLAPIVFAVHQDCIDRTALDPEDLADPAMVDTLDSAFVEHDCFALFSRLMDRASVFYEVGPDKASGIGERSSIVERSQHIHEMLLTKVDPELAAHLKRIDVLPQIFLM